MWIKPAHFDKGFFKTGALAQSSTEKNLILKVGISHSPPLLYATSKNTPSGPFGKIWQIFAERFHRKVKFIQFPAMSRVRFVQF